METGMRSDQILMREEVRRKYADSALGLRDDCCEVTGGLYTEDELSGLPDDAVTASLGCGNPTAVAELREGDTVLDLGSGGGIDVILSAKRVGPSGFAYGVDMTEEMLALARKNAREAGVKNVEFLEGLIEDIPLGNDAVDVIISNCVINLAVEKQAVFAEMYRVLRPGGRIGISDIVADDGLTTEERAERGSWVGCIAGALSVSEYRAGMTGAGFTNVTLTPTHDVAEGMSSMIVRAEKQTG
jgi:SAM-dependent methyltransferase